MIDTMTAQKNGRIYYVTFLKNLLFLNIILHYFIFPLDK